jgi:hydrogenase-1 operon protein HyaE
MRHPLIQRLHDEFGYPELTVENHDEFAAPDEIGVLFFAGDPNRYKETTDVAVVLPELARAFGDRLRPAVVAKADEIELQKKYVSRMKNWSEYLEEISELLTAQPRQPAGFRVLQQEGASAATGVDS